MTPPPAALALRRFADAARCADALADAVAADLIDAAAARGRAGLIVAGGATPVPFFQALATRPLPWAAITVTLSDERWVPPDHPDSNEAAVRRWLLDPLGATGPHFIALKTPAPTAAQAAIEGGGALAALRPFDVAVLGVGEDGHVASLFPGDEAALAATGGCVAVRGPKPPPERLSLTMDVLGECRRLYLHTRGADKLAALQAPGDLPLGRLLRRAHSPVGYHAAA